MTAHPPTRRIAFLATCGLVLALAMGCGGGPETAYGTLRGSSLNGTGAFAELLRSQGHEVRAARRLTDETAGWSEVIVRFAATPGPPGRDEAGWYARWLTQRPGRSLVYVVRGYDAEPEYWDRVLAQLSGEDQPERRAEAELRRGRALRWANRLPPAAEKPADPGAWFSLLPAVEPPATCKALGGPWAQGVDAQAAAIPLRQAIRDEPGRTTALLTGDGKVLAAEWRVEGGGDVLVLASAAFLLNLPMATPARRPLAEQVADWIAAEPSRVAFVEGLDPLGPPRGPRTLLELVEDLPTFRWIAVHLGLFAVVAGLARAVRLGRARREPPPGAGRPAAHAEALGELLAQSRGGPAAAREILGAYRRWRSGDETTERSS
ncbi:hypothetical protein OJF2_24560 [Aquisphaera giovannonii]|uniref:DUF4350 domain-containing protein n=1 Tax=Aquisphaera giovannonii TaxID=406548 RepID=A0A5B9W122_9BACT|nr:hypothetical protein [Aquisphaera giovannonii]QEH33924.1 hypothetical protein OJF2_24560 [Aquisphaera giovannonii]